MTSEITMLAFSAAAVAFMHTVLGPDHYLPFVAMAKSRDWGLVKAVRVTLLCGFGHVLASLAVGAIGIALGGQLSSLAWFEGLRGGLAAWMLVGFGLAYTAWGLRQAARNRPHTHWHHHDGLSHSHQHVHQATHAHLHDRGRSGAFLGPWLIFLIFVLGPCEPLIPMLMYPAAGNDATGVLVVAAVFGVVTVATMVAVVVVALLGLNSVRIRRLERHGHTLAGLTILACGIGIALLGL